MPSARSVGVGLGAGRSTLGAAWLAAPLASVRLLGLDTATAARISWLARMAAARDVVLGAGTVACCARRRGAAGWLLAGAAADLADAAVLAQALRDGRVSGAPVTGIVVGAAAAAGLATWAAVEPARRVRRPG